MAIIEITEVINAPVTKVMALANDPKRQHEWVPGVVDVQVTSGTRGRVGESWLLTFSMMGMKSRAQASIVEWEDNNKVVWRIEGNVNGVQTLTYEPIGDRSTRSKMQADFKFKGFMGLMSPIMVPMMRRNARRGAANLKRLCEAEAKK